MLLGNFSDCLGLLGHDIPKSCIGRVAVEADDPWLLPFMGLKTLLSSFCNLFLVLVKLGLIGLSLEVAVEPNNFAKSAEGP